MTVMHGLCRNRPPHIFAISLNNIIETSNWIDGCIQWFFECESLRYMIRIYIYIYIYREYLL